LDGSLYADTARLLQHRDLILQERRTAQQLCEYLSYARRCAPPEEAPVYDRLIGEAGRLSAYFRAMADQVDLMAMEVGRMSQQISMALRDAHG
jgi:hypothetical protein